MSTIKVGEAVKFDAADHKLKVGDKIKLLADNCHSNWGAAGSVVEVIATYPGGNARITGDWLLINGTRYAPVLPERTPSLADTLRLYPQDKTILAHLERGKPITPMKAMTIYGFTRLAAQIHRIRKAGYKVEMTLRRDEREHQYAEYRLAA